MNIDWNKLRNPSSKEILYYYDGPMMWTSKESGELRIWSVIEMNDDTRIETILGVPITEEHLELILLNKMYLRDAFESEHAWLVDLTYEHNLIKITEIDSRGKDDFLPEAGIYLFLE
jgi:hypothetical protein